MLFKRYMLFDFGGTKIRLNGEGGYRVYLTPFDAQKLQNYMAAC